MSTLNVPEVCDETKTASETQSQMLPNTSLQAAPTKAPRPRYPFFMSLKDMGFWARSARADALLARLEREHGTQKAFDLLYSQMPDPWGFNVAGYRYQRLKYEKILAMLPVRHYGAALDVGCGLGLLTRRLADRADTVLGVELSSVGVANAQKLSGDYANVTYQQGDARHLSRGLAGPFDLIVLADVLYYLTPLSDAVLKSVLDSICGLLAPGGVVLLANHYFFSLDKQSRRIGEIHAGFRWASSLERIAEERHPFFLATVFQKRADVSEEREAAHPIHAQPDSPR